MCMGLYVGMCMLSTGTCKGQKGALDTQKLELQVVVKFLDVDAGKQTCVLWMGNMHS